MPIYEFYCQDCHTIFSFYSARVAPEARPMCPKCRRLQLARRPSTFSTIKHKGDEEPTPFDHLDETRLEGAMEALAGEMGDLEETEDPRQLSRFFRRFGELTGLELGPRMEDALRRLEAGEDIESVEDEMGDDPDDDSLDEFFKLKKAILRSRKRPQIDDTLYFL